MSRMDIFSEEDLNRIKEYGLDLHEVLRQLDVFKTSAPYMDLVRPCRPGDGIRIIYLDDEHELIETYDKRVQSGGIVKFVPASGAASRMFKVLQNGLKNGEEILRESVEKEALAGRKDKKELLEFIAGINNFAFFEDLKSVMSKQGLRIHSLIREGRFRDIIHFLIDKTGLDYSNLPKGLLKFHSYPDRSRTAFEEQLVEGASYVADINRRCRLHFTVSPEHREKFISHLEEVRPYYEQRYQVSFDVSFSVQKKSTDTIAVDSDNNPFRDEHEKILFRPGGHGSLIENLNDLDAEIVFIKNIDNVVPDRLKPDTVRWKKILGGYLIALQTRVFGYLKKLSGSMADQSILNEITGFIERDLFLKIPEHIDAAPTSEKVEFLKNRLNRPIRVCGLVRNQGEPGGGPFWVRDQHGEISAQIVESAQIDPASAGQQEILASSTHFNPVDLVAGIRNFENRRFDLRRYIDKGAVFISQKSQNGRELKALEHPGLWNGAMAGWITAFVEVPITTFNPVKTVNDLLRKEHQQG
ncbi:conserved hypothetical protein [uncultured Desulfobacterium sp.]|uniref:DUF4301 domain-containing protein n=1 Tax=uncultured Desulfobacterium sp. TaxID=201089 RepID=A0A445MWX8_9BACT|nr:conserved hypothetical protein [uncultured Desulfobacterium sp.]